MGFDHERLDVYRLALDFLVFAERVIRSFPRGRAHFADQLSRASLSIVLNVAEGAGKLSPPDKRRYYLSARGSATECAALLDASVLTGHLPAAEQQLGRDMLLRIVAMLVMLSRTFENRPPISPDPRPNDPQP